MDYNARWYSPSLGRFTQPDTIIPSLPHPQALNRYSYVLNNPINLVDPSGNRYCDWDAGSGGCSQVEFEEDYDWDPRTWSYGGGGNGTDPYCDKPDVDCNLRRNEFIADVAAIVPIGETVDDVLTVFTGCGISCQLGYEEELDWRWRLVFAGALFLPGIGGRHINYAVDGAGGFIRKGVDTIQVTAAARSVDQFLDDALNFLGDKYDELADGVFRSNDGLRQVRFTESDLTDAKMGPHGHLEILDDLGNFLKNIHISLIGD